MAFSLSPSLSYQNNTDHLQVAHVTSTNPSGINDLMVTINRIYTALVIIIGTIGNAYCLYIIRSTSLRKFSSSQYLFALACSDLGFLLSLSLTWLSGAGIRWYHVIGVCQLANYASYVCCFLSAWYILALTFERMLVVYRPFYARTVASPKRARIVIFLITILGLLMNSFILILVESQTIDHHENFDHSSIDQINRFLENRSLVEESETNFYHSLAGFDPIDRDHFGIPSPNQPIGRFVRHSSKNFTTDQGDHSDQIDSQFDKPPMIYHCMERYDTSELYDIFNTIDMIFSFSVPLFFTFLFNIFICIRLIKANRERKNILACHSTRGGSFRCVDHSMIIASSSAVQELKNISPTISSNDPQIDRSSPKIDETILINRNPLSYLHVDTSSPSTVALELEASLRKPLMDAFKRHYDRLRANSISTGIGSPSLEKERHITLFLVSISLTHLILNLPSYLYRLIQTVASGSQTRSQEGGGEIESIVLSILYLLFYTQFAVNFILYSCQSRKIRGRIRRES